MLKKLLFTAILATMAQLSFALDPIYTPWYNNLAIRGYDPVAYFTDNKAVEGSQSYEWEWQGAVWRFASEEHRTLFQQAPLDYAPQYGGYCAYAVAKDSTASIEPEQFSIVDGKLYLNYNKKIQQQWLDDQAEFIKLADQYWPGLLDD